MTKPQREKNAFIGEVFSSIQGEGLYVGVKQIFVRFMHCSLNCIYCDTPYSRMKDGFCSVETDPGTKKFMLFPNPVNIQKLNKFIKTLDKKSPGHHSISVTGGEPLEQVEFLKDWLGTLKKNFKIYLETNGTLPQALKKILHNLDIIAMDIKLPTSTKGRAFWNEHSEFLKLAARKEVFVKVVITAKTDKYEVLKSALLVEKINKKIPFVLQPASKYGNFNDAPQIAFVRELQSTCSRILKNTRVIPQVHIGMGIN